MQDLQKKKKKKTLTLCLLYHMDLLSYIKTIQHDYVVVVATLDHVPDIPSSASQVEVRQLTRTRIDIQ